MKQEEEDELTENCVSCFLAKIEQQKNDGEASLGRWK